MEDQDPGVDQWHPPYGPSHPPPPLPPAPPPPSLTRDEARAALGSIQHMTLPVRRRDLVVYAVGTFGVWMMAWLVLVLSESWTQSPVLVGLLAGLLVVPFVLLRNLVPVVPAAARRITLVGLLVTILWSPAARMLPVSTPLQIALSLLPAVIAGAVLVHVGARRP